MSDGGCWLCLHYAKPFEKSSIMNALKQSMVIRRKNLLLYEYVKSQVAANFFRKMLSGVYAGVFF